MKIDIPGTVSSTSGKDPRTPTRHHLPSTWYGHPSARQPPCHRPHHIEPGRAHPPRHPKHLPHRPGPNGNAHHREREQQTRPPTKSIESKDAKSYRAPPRYTTPRSCSGQSPSTPKTIPAPSEDIHRNPRSLQSHSLQTHPRQRHLQPARTGTTITNNIPANKEPGFHEKGPNDRIANTEPPPTTATTTRPTPKAPSPLQPWHEVEDKSGTLGAKHPKTNHNTDPIRVKDLQNRFTTHPNPYRQRFMKEFQSESGPRHTTPTPSRP